MPRTWIVIDANYLCWRAFHTTGQLSFGEKPTGVIFGFLKAVREMQKLFGQRVVFAFDHGKNIRLEKLPGYKSTRKAMRKKMSEEDKEKHLKMQKQIELLKTKYLRQVGYRNVFYQEGYEADDIIASVVLNSIPKTDTIVIVSADKDLYQLIRKDRITIYNPHRMVRMNGELFTKTYDLLNPRHWVGVKAIAGCSTDDIPGVPHVGEKTAIKILKLLEECAKTPRVLTSGESHMLAKNVEFRNRTKRNMKLVRLPYPGCKTFQLWKDKVTSDKWNELMKNLGMKSLIGKDDPVSRRKAARRGFNF
jgi:5'-3' exonuclease